MADRKDQPAVLRRKIARLEALLAAEKERADKAFVAYREALYESVECQMKLERIAAVLNGEDEIERLNRYIDSIGAGGVGR